MRISKITTFILCLTCFLAVGQTEKGKFMIGGSSSGLFNSTKIENDFFSSKNDQFTFSVNSGYFIVDNLSLGLELSFISSNENNIKSSITTFSPFAKYYFLKSNFKPFAIASYGLGISKFDFQVLDFGDLIIEKADGDVNQFAIGAGAAYFINKYISLELTLLYANQKIETEIRSLPSSEEKSNGFQSSIGFNIFL